jgi:hypothetical protein
MQRDVADNRGNGFSFGPWTCFHCGETFTDVAAAMVHFGATPGAEPGCLLQVPDGGLLARLRELELENEKLRAENEQLDHEASSWHGMAAELARCFEGAKTVHQASLVLDAMEGRALAAEQRARALLEIEALQAGGYNCFLSLFAARTGQRQKVVFRARHCEDLSFERVNDDNPRRLPGSYDVAAAVAEVLKQMPRDVALAVESEVTARAIAPADQVEELPNPFPAAKRVA